MRLNIVSTEQVNDQPYFIGIHFKKIASVHESNKKMRQIRLGLIFWHVVFTFQW